MYVEAQSVSKEYATVRAVDQVSLVAQGGEILALLGPNGAGKSSLVRMLVGLTQPDEGAIIYRAGPDGSEQTLATEAFGYLPEDRGLYLDRTIVDNLNYIARLRGLDKAKAKHNIDHWLARFDLSERATEPMRQLSKGNQQKVQLIATLLHDPKLVILDEPFSGLDPVNQEFVLRVLEELRAAGTTVILSAHQMALVERMADKLVLMNKGKVIAQGSLPQVRQQLQKQQCLLVEFNTDVDAETVAQVPQVHVAESRDGRNYVLQCDDSVAPEVLLVALQHCAPVTQFSRQQHSLHELYLQAVQS